MAQVPRQSCLSFCALALAAAVVAVGTADKRAAA
eukprot:CAMPEP_0206842854 /NCGR_PEP_ID=MMETSP0975-20121206/23167_1 /ASSEMBLY_ACC=CAM_ASM_000399 /TAXON_ID=483370 /ORGANISM="non described non described, Strain CCMP2097" /LENGTH=33 /DNA_ID= /DNA_START= /DNA_END= /DNA_ORIENTATION=